ncbi:MAG TPA: hypothetical protein VJ843_05010 [Candidatus Saccharimonadales bacterium]|nr:hypothetical protein [Candidatus Saccharimonadales bacterium]
MTITDLASTIWDYYDVHGRHDLPWRKPVANGSFDPYKIMVSEIMLQQTQVARVIPKYEQFLQAFPTVSALADAPLAAVLQVWNGLGYNRRAKFLWQAAQYVQTHHGGVFPHAVADLVELPGVGKNTAGAIATYAFNSPETFIETNIRTVFIHHFFADHADVSDAALLPYISQALNELSPARTPREWYWALMDYGTFLKQTVGNVSRKSKSYAKQSAFTGSKRQVRGQVLRVLATAPQTSGDLAQLVVDDRLATVLADLIRENMIFKAKGRYHLGTAS